MQSNRFAPPSHQEQSSCKQFAGEVTVKQGRKIPCWCLWITAAYLGPAAPTGTPTSPWTAPWHLNYPGASLLITWERLDWFYSGRQREHACNFWKSFLGGAPTHLFLTALQETLAKLGSRRRAWMCQSINFTFAMIPPSPAGWAVESLLWMGPGIEIQADAEFQWRKCQI